MGFADHLIAFQALTEGTVPSFNGRRNTLSQQT